MKIDINKKLLGKYMIAVSLLLIVINIFSDLINSNKEISFGYAQKLFLYFSILILLLGFYFLFPKLIKKGLRIGSNLLFLVGIILLLINIYGEFSSLRNPNINQNIYAHEGIDRSILIPADEVYSSFEKQSNENIEDYVYRLKQLIFDGTIHYWVGDKIIPQELEKTVIRDYHLQVPIYENFILWGNSFFENNMIYEFCNPYLAIERGTSVCSQSSKIVARLLEIEGYDIRLTTLDGHVVTEVLIDNSNNEWWVLDADLGVVIEHDIGYLENNIDEVKQIYREAGYPESNINKYGEIYKADGNFVFQETMSRTCEIEENIYRLKWQIPIIFLIPFNLLLLIEFISKLVTYKLNKNSD